MTLIVELGVKGTCYLDGLRRLAKDKNFFIIDCLCIAFDLFLNPELVIERKLWNSIFLWLWRW